MAGSLDGVRIIDLTTIYSGPIATSILGDQGADVIKVESPSGDLMRMPYTQERNGVTGAFAMMNRNKRSAVIDLAQEEGKAVLKRLVEQADVVVENFRPGVMERLEIGYEQLSEINPRIVYASINGVGHSGPYAGRRVYDAVIQAISGMAALQADPDAGRPVMVNTLVCDKLTSITAAQVICSALYARERTGVGQRIDISMLDSSLFFLWPDSMLNYTFVGDDVAPAPPFSHASFVRQTADGYICTMPVSQDEWLGLFRALDLPNLLEDDRFKEPDGLASELFQQTLDDAYRQFPTSDLEVRLEQNEVPFARINSKDAVLEDPQVKAMGALLEFEHPIAGAMRQPRPPGRFSATPAEIFRCSPELGEQTREVLGEFGFSAEEISDLRVRKVVR